MNTGRFIRCTGSESRRYVHFAEEKNKALHIRFFRFKIRHEHTQKRTYFRAIRSEITQFKASESSTR